MADYCINLFLNEEQQKQIGEIGLGDFIKDIEGKKGVQVSVGPKEHKKLLKSFPDLEFDQSNACVLPEEAQLTLMDVIMQTKTLDVMKLAIVKLHNPLKGKELRSKVY